MAHVQGRDNSILINQSMLSSKEEQVSINYLNIYMVPYVSIIFGQDIFFISLMLCRVSFICRTILYDSLN